MVNFSKEMIIPPLFNDSSNGISNRQLRQIFKVYYFFISNYSYHIFIILI